MPTIQYSTRSARLSVHKLFISCIRRGLMSRDSIIDGDWLPATESCQRYLPCYQPASDVSEKFGSTFTPRGAGVPPFRLCSSLVHSLSHLLLFITFPLFLFSFTLVIFFYCPSDPFLPESSHSVFQARGRRRRPNLGLVCFLFMIVLSVLLS